jgi:hypothetical protein
MRTSTPLDEILWQSYRPSRHGQFQLIFMLRETT